MATLKKVIDGWRCSNCMMILPQLQAYCSFCGEPLSNFASLTIEQSMSDFRNDVDAAPLTRPNLCMDSPDAETSALSHRIQGGGRDDNS